MVIFQYARHGARRLAQYLHGRQILGHDIYRAAVQRGLRYGAGAGLSLALSVVPAVAQITPDTLYTFTPGTTIRSAEVNFNFTELYTSFGDALNRTGGTMTGTLTAQVIVPDGDNTRNFGSAGASWASAWFDGTVTAATISVTTLTCTDCIALTTETSGNYVATITAGSGISGTVASEGSTPTIALAALTAEWSQTGAFDITLANADSELKILESTGATYYGIFDVGDLGSADATYTFSGTSGTVYTTANDPFDTSGEIQAVAVGGDATGTVGNIAVSNDSHTHDAGNLTGTTLAAGVVSTSITSTGTVATGTWSASFGNASVSAVAGGTYSGDDSITTVGTITTGSWNAGSVSSSETITSTKATGLGLVIDSSTLVVDATNNMVGIGRDDPTTTLGFVDNATIGLGSSAGLIEFDDQATDEVNILNANVGIGTSTPASLLEVSQAATGAGAIITLRNATEASGNYTGVLFAGTSTANQYTKGGLFYINDGSGYGRGDFVVAQNAVADTSNAVVSATTFVVKNSGNVGIGDTTPAALLTVGNGDPFQVSTTGHTTISPSATTGTALTISHNGASAQGASFTNTGAADQVLSLTDSDGTCQAQPTTTGLTWSCSSDARLKTQIADASQSALAALRAIRIREFVTLANQEFHPFGVVAQELQVVDSTMVRSYVGSDLLYASTPSPWLMVRAIQELSAEVDRLQTRLSALERRP